MGTVFEIVIADDDPQYARHAAVEAFRELDKLEQDISNFIQNSDISRIGSLKANESTRVSPDTFECLRQCAYLYQVTQKAFDATIGSLYEIWLDKEKNLLQPTEQQIRLAMDHTGMDNLVLEDGFVVTSLMDNVKVDLGAFGKGYGLDKLAVLLREWDIANFLMHGGYSSVLAGGAAPGKDGWRVTMTNPFGEKAIIKDMEIKDASLSGSGLEKGQHIIDPRTGRPLDKTIAAWALAPTAALSDALSTAFMIMELQEIEIFCKTFNDIKAVIVSGENEDEVFYFGEW